jgi:hypothetical protein
MVEIFWILSSIYPSSLIKTSLSESLYVGGLGENCRKSVLEMLNDVTIGS